MNNVIVYLDEAAHAMHMLTPLLASGPTRTPTRWIVLGCAPRITHSASKYVTNSTRQSWRGKCQTKYFHRSFLCSKAHRMLSSPRSRAVRWAI